MKLSTKTWLDSHAAKKRRQFKIRTNLFGGRKGLVREATMRKKINLYVADDCLAPSDRAQIDLTFSCTLLSSYRAQCARDATAIFYLRDQTKQAKHLLGCLQQGVSYLSLVCTDFFAFGPPPTVDYLDSAFHPAFVAERASGASGSAAMRRREHLFLRLQTCLAGNSASAIEFYLADHSPPAPAAPIQVFEPPPGAISAPHPSPSASPTPGSPHPLLYVIVAGAPGDPGATPRHWLQSVSCDLGSAFATPFSLSIHSRSEAFLLHRQWFERGSVLATDVDPRAVGPLASTTAAVPLARLRSLAPLVAHGIRLVRFRCSTSCCRTVSSGAPDACHASTLAVAFCEILRSRPLDAPAQ